MTHRYSQKNSGFTFVEIMVVMTIFLVLSIMVSDYLIKGLRSNVFGYEQDSAVQNARLAANAIAKELREAMTSVEGPYMIDKDRVATNTITFFADTDNNLLSERIRYFASGTDLMRGVTIATGTPMTYNLANEKISRVANYLNNQNLPIFTYYNASSTLIANPASSTSMIRMIHVLLKINVTPERAPADYFYETDIQIRNLKDNL